MNWKLWAKGEVHRESSDVTPMLAQWLAKTHPAEIRLREHVDNVVKLLSPLPDNAPLFLHLQVDVQQEKNLLRHHDLENYLTPLFGVTKLPPNRFVRVSAIKRVGGGSLVTCGYAVPVKARRYDDWSHFSVNAGRGCSTTKWKENLRQLLMQSSPVPLPPGPAKVCIAWQCASSRNWTTLWKPTGDSMGPVLGCTDMRNVFNLHDDRIIDLELHRQTDDTLKHDVLVGMWWASAL